jgi:hypothetical protein
MGGWSGFQLHTNLGIHINVITAYQAPQANGPRAVYQQKIHMLTLQGHIHPDPRKTMLTDLSQLIQTYNESGDKTILMIDTNDNLFSSNSLLHDFISTTNMVSLVKNTQHHPLHTFAAPSASTSSSALIVFSIFLLCQVSQQSMIVPGHTPITEAFSLIFKKHIFLVPPFTLFYHPQYKP